MALVGRWEESLVLGLGDREQKKSSEVLGTLGYSLRNGHPWSTGVTAFWGIFKC